ncbi:hypothetical protein CPB83DRAFT_860044 [Crepidotus variabilis]|uniref:2'-phosphotransferase n=1 Tax=Crepidotus variabilis TaxID=179855 RepID=A0A9P6EA14_9AGAR|nr:hypothetical protein CPB83DRAFT_860044 [Crepidotus variabilis]
MFACLQGIHKLQPLTQRTIDSSNASKRTFSTLFSETRKKAADFRELQKIKSTLFYLLRPNIGRELGLYNRDDGYVSVKRLLNLPEFSGMDVSQLQTLIDRDEDRKFRITLDPTKGDDCWWLRAKEWNETTWVMKPLFKRDHPGAAVYPTTMKEYESHIARNGIPRNGKEWIEVIRGISTEDFLDSLKDEEQVLIFLNIPKCIEGGLRFFSPTPAEQSWVEYTPIVTKGNSMGYIPPSLFQTVEVIRAKKRLIWGNPKPMNNKTWFDITLDDDAFEKDGNRKSLLKEPDSVSGVFKDLKAQQSVYSGLSVKKQRGVADEANHILTMS